MTTATTARPKSGFFVGVGCPGCGGEIELDRDFFVTACKYCGSVLRIVRPESPVAYMVRSRIDIPEARFHLDRYLKEHDLPLTGSRLMIKQLYYPYWKLDGTLLKLRNRVDKRFVHVDTGSGSSEDIEVSTPKSDISASPYSVTVAAGSSMPSVPDTLGVRTDTVTMLPFSRDNVEDDFDALPVMRPWEEVQQQLKVAISMVSSVDQPAFGENQTRLFDPVLSLVYFPYFLMEGYRHDYRRFAVDGLTGRVLGSVDEPCGNSEDNSPVTIGEPPEITFGELDVDFHRCSNCGVDLPPEFSHVYVCENCHQLHMLKGSSLKLTEIHAAAPDDSDNSTMIPFWSLRLPADQAARFGRLLGGLDTPEKIVIPAIRTGNLEAMHRLAKRMTAASSRIETHTVESLNEHFRPVQIGLAEAISQAEMLLCREVMRLKKDVTELDVAIRPTEIGLTYIPFHRENYFYVDSILNAVGVEKQLLE